jgi:uncharacterized membrane protein YeiH
MNLFDLSHWGTFTLGNFTIIDLIAATTNAFNAALLARRPSHWRHYTTIGIILLAILGGIVGGVTRDVILDTVPDPLTNPWYVILCFVSAVLALSIAYRSGQRFREGLFQLMTAFSLPWYAVIGANKALGANLPYVAAILIGVVGATAGRYLVDITSGVTPKQFVRGEWFVGAAVLAATVYIVCAEGFGLSIWPATLISVTVAFAFRLAALIKGWEEPEPWEPEEVRVGEVPRRPLGDTLRETFATSNPAHDTVGQSEK